VDARRNDLVDIRRIESVLNRHGKRFKEKYFTPHEIEKAKTREKAGTHAHVFAKRYAAKEACTKALGTGFSNGVSMKDIGVIEDENGRPFLQLTGGAQAYLKTITPDNMHAHIHLSLTDEPPLAQAFVIIEARPL